MSDIIERIKIYLYKHNIIKQCIISTCYNYEIHKTTHCPISLESFKTDEVIIILPCNHIFSQESIFTWLQINASCPLCRYPIPIDKDYEPRRTLYHSLNSNIHIILLFFCLIFNIMSFHYLCTRNHIN